MELEQYVAVIKRWWGLMVACVLVATGSSYYGTLQMPRTYQATTTVMIGQVMEEANPSSQDLAISTQLAQTYADMVRRRPILEGAAQALGLAYVPSAGDISTRQVPGTQLLEISVRDTNPERAAVLANEIAYQLIQRSPGASEDQQRQDFAREQLSDLERKIEATQEEVEEEQERLDAANSARAIQQYQANISALEQRLSSYQSTYASLLTSVEGGTNVVSIVERAYIPTNPVSPNVPETILLAAAIGLALAVGGAFLIEYLDDTVKSPDDVARATELPILGTIPCIGGDTYPEKLVAARHPRSPIVEAYRALRTNVQFSTMDKPAQTLMITSPSPGAGKSVTMANLAVVMAQAGLKVIVVDSDLRRPALDKIFGLTNGYGLSNAILQDNPTLSDHLRATEVDNLWVLPSGSPPPNPAELLGSQRMEAIVEELKGQADLVLFDSPPVLAVTDAAVLSTRVDGVLVVCNAGRTRRKDAQKGVEELRRVGANLLGAVLNDMSARQGDHYYYYYDSQTEGGEREGRLAQWRSWLQRMRPFWKPSTEEVEADASTDRRPSGVQKGIEKLRRGGANLVTAIRNRLPAREGGNSQHHADSLTEDGEREGRWDRHWRSRLHHLLPFLRPPAEEMAETTDRQ
jgi:capsular exopolysaccharide synthesis family protein